MKRSLLLVVVAVVLLTTCALAGCGSPTEEETAALADAQEAVGEDSQYWSPYLLETVLEYKGHSAEAIAYAVDNCGIDWNANALNFAESLVYRSTVKINSRTDLVRHIVDMGYTEDQATYAADQLGY